MNPLRLPSVSVWSLVVAGALLGACNGRQDLLDEGGAGAGAAGEASATGGSTSSRAGSGGGSAAAAGGNAGSPNAAGQAGSTVVPLTPAKALPYATSCLPNADGGAANALQEEIIACGLSPALQLAGADDDGVAFFDRDQGDLRRLDRTTAAITLLREGELVFGSTLGPAIRDGKLFFFDFDQRLRSIDLRTGKERGHGYATQTSAIVFDDTYAYVGFSTDFGAPTRIGRLRHDTASSGFAKSLGKESATPTAADGGFVYFHRSPSEVRRIPVAGGDSELVFTLPAIPSSATSSAQPFTVADGQLYFVRHGGKGGQHAIVTRPVAPPAQTTAVEATLLLLEDGDCGCGPTRLRAYGDLLLVGNTKDVIGIPRQAPAQARRLFSQPLAHQDVVVDERFVYGAFVRGGIDTPIEGYIARVPRTLSTAVIP